MTPLIAGGYTFSDLLMGFCHQLPLELGVPIPLELGDPLELGVPVTGVLTNSYKQSYGPLLIASTDPYL